MFIVFAKRHQIFEIAAILLLLVCSGAPVNGADGWLKIRTKNFLFIGDAREKEMRRSAERLEEFRETIHQMFPALKLDGGVRTTVVVFKDASSYEPFKPRRPDGTIDSAVSGYFQPGKHANYITLSNGNTDSSYGTIFHEYVHYLLDANIGRSDIPPWLNEGFAEYFETMLFLDRQHVVVGTPPEGHLGLLRTNKIIPFKTFLATDHSSLHDVGGTSRSLFYAQAWGLIHYLFSTAGVSDNFDNVIAALKNSETSDKLFSRLFRAEPTEIESALQKYLVTLPLRTRTIKLLQKSGGSEAMTVVSLSDAETSAYLGDLLYHRGNLADAEHLLRKALNSDSTLGIANMSLGLVLSKNKNFREAREYLEKAIAADQTNPTAYINYAYSLILESADEKGDVALFSPELTPKIQNALRRAISLDPDFVDSYRLLAFVGFVNDTDLDGSVDLLKRGLARRPGDQDIILLLAKILLRQEKYDEARASAVKLFSSTNKENIKISAREIIATVDEYKESNATALKQPQIRTISGTLLPLILKRSTLTDQDVRRYDEERVITNLNLLVQKPDLGETQVVGYIERITCKNAEINFTVSSGNEKFSLISSGFSDIGLSVLTEGERSFTLDCGIGLGKQLTVLNYRPNVENIPSRRGRLRYIAFVPDIFRLKTSEEMANTRTVIIEDDRDPKTRPKPIDQPIH